MDTEGVSVPEQCSEGGIDRKEGEGGLRGRAAPRHSRAPWESRVWESPPFSRGPALSGRCRAKCLCRGISNPSKAMKTYLYRDKELLFVLGACVFQI